MNCKLCEIIHNKDKYNIAYETDSYIVVLLDPLDIPVLILKQHQEFISKEDEYKFLIEFGNYAEYHFGDRNLTINRKHSSHFKHLVWVASHIDYKQNNFPGFLEQWQGIS